MSDSQLQETRACVGSWHFSFRQNPQVAAIRNNAYAPVGSIKALSSYLNEWLPQSVGSKLRAPGCALKREHHSRCLQSSLAWLHAREPAFRRLNESSKESRSSPSGQALRRSALHKWSLESRDGGRSRPHRRRPRKSRGGSKGSAQ